MQHRLVYKQLLLNILNNKDVMKVAINQNGGKILQKLLRIIIGI